MYVWLENTLRTAKSEGVPLDDADEVRRLGLGDVRPETGRVLCTGTEADIPRLNIGLRCGERVLIELAAGPARSFEALFQLASAVPWEDLIPQNGRFPVKGHALDSQLHSVPDCQKTVKKAAADRLGRAYGLERLPEDGPLYQLQFSLLRDQCALYLDTTGPGLHKRGYRAVGVEAPLRETLAAAMVTLSRFRGKDPFRDPFCGSGTIAIEAALIAKNRAPGLERSFDAQKWACVDSRLWVEAAGEAMDREFDGVYDIWGGDADPKAVRTPSARTCSRKESTPGKISRGVIREIYSTYHPFFLAAISSFLASEKASGPKPPTSNRISSDRIRLTPLSRSLSASVKSKPSSSASRRQAR